VRERQLALAALFLAFVGIGIIAFSAMGLEPKKTEIALVDGEVGNYVEVFGTVKSAQYRDGNAFLRLCSGNACVAVVVFESAAVRMGTNPYLIKPGDRLVARGAVKEYGGEPEIIATALERI